jgi:hypothetical protein
VTSLLVLVGSGTVQIPADWIIGSSYASPGALAGFLGVLRHSTAQSASAQAVNGVELFRGRVANSEKLNRALPAAHHATDPGNFARSAHVGSARRNRRCLGCANMRKRSQKIIRCYPPRRHLKSALDRMR